MKKHLSIVFLFVFIIFSVSCEDKSHDSIKIGAVLPLTGNLAILGESAKTGLLLAEEYINSCSNNTRYIEFVLEDGQGNPTNSINALNKLMMYDKTDIVFSIVSAVDLSIIPIQKKNKFLMFSHSSHPQLSNVDSFFFRHSQTVEQEADFIMKRIGSATLTICFMQDDYGVAFDRVIKTIANEGQTKGSISFLPNESNFATIAKKIIDSKSDKVIICAGGKNISDLVRKLKEQNYQGEILTTLAFIVSGANLTVQNISNLTMVDFKKLDLNQDFLKFIKAFEQKYNKKIGTSELMFFNSAWLVYNNSTFGDTPEKISIEISKCDSVNILGNKVTVERTNDILPELVFIEK